MTYIKVTFKDADATDSMAFDVGNEDEAFDMLQELCGPLPRNSCTFEEISHEEYIEVNGFDTGDTDVQYLGEEQDE